MDFILGSEGYYKKLGEHYRLKYLIMQREYVDFQETIKQQMDVERQGNLEKMSLIRQEMDHMTGLHQ